MKGSKGRRWTLVLSAVAALIAVTSAIALRERAYEWWQIHRLRTDGWPAAQSAAEWLSEHGSPASFPALLDLPDLSDQCWGLLRESLIRHEEKCLPELGRYLRERQGPVPGHLIFRLEIAIRNNELHWVHAPALFVEALVSNDETVRKWGAGGLRMLGQETRQAKAALISALEDHCPVVRAQAVQALIEIGVREKTLLPALMRCLAEGALETYEAVWSLASAAQMDAILLEELLQRAEPIAKQIVLDVLWKLDALAVTWVPSLPRLIASSDTDVSVSAVLLLARAGLELETAAPVVLRLLDDPVGPRWRRAVTVLPGLGASARTGVAALVRALETGTGEAPRIAAGALGRLGSTASAAEHALIEALEAPDAGTRLCAARALPEVAIESAPMIAALEARLVDPVTAVRVRAAASLVLLEPDRNQALLPVIESALQGGDQNTSSARREAARALANLRHVSAESSRRLIELGLSDEDIRPLAVSALRAGSLVDVTSLRRALLGYNEYDRRRGCDFIAALGPCARAVTYDLIGALGDTHGFVRAAAAAALGSIEAEPAVAIPVLETAMEDKSLEVRQEARKALEKLRPRR